MASKFLRVATKTKITS